jgi:hypothetical protein
MPRQLALILIAENTNYGASLILQFSSASYRFIPLRFMQATKLKWICPT